MLFLSSLSNETKRKHVADGVLKLNQNRSIICSIQLCLPSRKAVLIIHNECEFIQKRVACLHSMTQTYNIRVLWPVLDLEAENTDRKALSLAVEITRCCVKEIIQLHR